MGSTVYGPAFTPALPNLRVTDDMHNNHLRHCNLPGDLPGQGRLWLVAQALKDITLVGSVTHYVVLNVRTYEQRIVRADDLHNLY